MSRRIGGNPPDKWPVRPATSSATESLREQIEEWLMTTFGPDVYDGEGKGRIASDDADALIAAVPALQPASSHLRAAVEAIRPVKLRANGEWSDVPALIRRSDVLALLDTAQPDLRRTPEAEIDVELLTEAISVQEAGSTHPTPLLTAWSESGDYWLNSREIAERIADRYAKLAARLRRRSDG